MEMQMLLMFFSATYMKMGNLLNLFPPNKEENEEFIEHVLPEKKQSSRPERHISL